MPTLDDVWRAMADVTAMSEPRPAPPRATVTAKLPPISKPPRPNDWARPQETKAKLEAVAVARSKIAVTEVRGPTRSGIRRAPDPPWRWSVSERRLWWMAGALMLLAAGVMGTLAVLTFGFGRAPAAVIASTPLHASVAVAAEEPARAAETAPATDAPAKLEAEAVHARAVAAPVRHHRHRRHRRIHHR